MGAFADRVLAWGHEHGVDGRELTALAATRLSGLVGVEPGPTLAGDTSRRDRFARDVTVDGSPFELAVGLAQLHEAALTAHERIARGAHYTPFAVAERLCALAFDYRKLDPRDASVCDPAMGGGIFLVAAARVLMSHGAAGPALVERLFGVDIDAIAVAVARIALALVAGGPVDGIDERLVCGDTLADDGVRPHEGRCFDVVVGNPPFLSQLRDRSARERHDARRLVARYGTAAKGYVDTSALFLLRACEQAQPAGGVVAMIQPQSLLASGHASALRDELTRRSALAALWFARKPLFAASVRVCAPVLILGNAAADAPAPVRRFVDADFAEAEPCAPPSSAASWSVLAADLLGVPRLTLPIEYLSSLADAGFRATAGFRDEYYGLAGAITEASSAPADAAWPRVATAGMIDPLRIGWGERPITHCRVRYARPVVNVEAIAAERVARWFRARLAPKILIATQTKVIECAVDISGSYVPLTPVIELSGDAGRLWHAAAALSGPVASACALRATAGSAMSIDALKLSARQVLALPAPTDLARWDEGAALAAGLAGGGGRPEWRRFGEVMCDAYGVASAEREPLVEWWLGRLPQHRSAGRESESP